MDQPFAILTEFVKSYRKECEAEQPNIYQTILSQIINSVSRAVKKFPLLYYNEYRVSYLLYKCLHGYYNINVYQYLQRTATTQWRTRSKVDDFKISINSARTEKAMVYFFYRVVKPLNITPYHVRSARCSNSEIVPFKNWLTKHYTHLTPTCTCYDTDHVFTWVSFCRCSGCRPAWILLLTLRFIFQVLYVILCKWPLAGSQVRQGMCLV